MSERTWLSTDVPIVEEETIARLLALMADVSEAGEDLARDLLETYRVDVDRRLAVFDDALRRGRREEAAEAVHALKGASATVGAPRVAALCREIERALGDGEDMDGASDAMRAAADAALAALRTRLRKDRES